MFKFVGAPAKMILSQKRNNLFGMNSGDCVASGNDATKDGVSSEYQDDVATKLPMNSVLLQE